jgi:epidermal growth factor receptor substrate 15
MPNRLGTPYQNDVHITDDYTAAITDDALIATSIAGGKTLTMPDPRTCTGDNARKKIVNLATSGGTLTLATASGTIMGAASLAVGEATTIESDGVATWTAQSKFSAEGLEINSISTADSKGVSGGTRASVADSKAVSGSLNTSTADSKAVSNSINTSTADSKSTSNTPNISVADSKAVSNSINTSTADSKGVSAGSKASIALSKLTSAGM